MILTPPLGDCQAHRVGGASRCVFCDRAMRAVQYVSPRPAPKLSRRKRSSPPPIPNIKFPKVY